MQSPHSLVEKPKCHSSPLTLSFPLSPLVSLPGVSDGEAPTVADTPLVDHELAEEARGTAGGQFGRHGASLPPLASVQLQVHVFFKGADASGVSVWSTQLVGRHADEWTGNYCGIFQMDPYRFRYFSVLSFVIYFPVSRRGYAMHRQGELRAGGKQRNSG